MSLIQVYHFKPKSNFHQKRRTTYSCIHISHFIMIYKGMMFTRQASRQDESSPVVRAAFIPRPIPIRASRKPLIPPAVELPKGMKWGEPIWTGLHTMSVKVRSEMFPSIKMELMDIVKNVCHQLPCPDCSSHAMKFLSTVNINHMRTKEDFIEMLYTFHNQVSARKGLPLFAREAVLPTYGAKNLVAAVQRMMIAFMDRYGVNTRLLTSQLVKHRIFNSMRVWFGANMDKFEQ